MWLCASPILTYLKQRATLTKQASVHQAKVSSWLHSSEDMDKCSKGLLLCCFVLSCLSLLLLLFVVSLLSCLTNCLLAYLSSSLVNSLSSSVSHCSRSFMFCSIAHHHSCMHPTLSSNNNLLIVFHSDLEECESYLLELNLLLKSMEVLHRTYSAPAISALQVNKGIQIKFGTV